MAGKVKYICVSCSGWRNIANGDNIFEFWFNEDGEMINRSKNIKNYNGMPAFKGVLSQISVSSLHAFASSGISSAKNQNFNVSTCELDVNECVYTVLSSFGLKLMGDTGCSLRYRIDYFD